MKHDRRNSECGETSSGPFVQMEWLGLKQLTRYASLSERTLRGWIHSSVNPLPAVRVGNKILVRKSDFDRWLQGHQVKSLATIDVDGIVREVLKGLNDGR